MSPDEVLDAGKVRVEELGIATVYRNLKLLTESGWLCPVDLPGEPTRYEVSGKPHHHHFLCRECDRAFEIEDCPGTQKFHVPSGFRVETHDVVLYGVCASCRGR
jgi:Fur family ferric uptake transcriptional regulator